MPTPDRITIDPNIMLKPCSNGWLGDYADLEREDILAPLAYAARLAHIKSTKVLAA